MVTGVLLQPDHIGRTACHLTCNILTSAIQRLQTPTDNISPWTDCSDFSFVCAIEIFLLTYYPPYKTVTFRNSVEHMIHREYSVLCSLTCDFIVLKWRLTLQETDE